MKWIKETHGKTGSTENEQKEGEYKDKTWNGPKMELTRSKKKINNNN